MDNNEYLSNYWTFKKFDYKGQLIYFKCHFLRDFAR